jgi:NIMA (never in mitosis gene a)-related kinase
MAPLNDKEKQNALNEVRILASINHPNIIGYKEAFFDDQSSTLNIVMEFADNGDLFEKINKAKEHKKYVKEDDIWNAFI